MSAALKAASAAERSIVHEAGAFWVLARRSGYFVMHSGPVYSVSDSAFYAPTPDGLSLAVARCDYLAKRVAQGGAA